MELILGIDLGTTVELCRTLTDAGVNAFDITAGMQCCFELMTPPTCMPKAWNAATSAAVKEALGDRVRVMLTGRISDADTAERVVRDGLADFAIMGRALIADSHLVEKYAAGRKDEICPCVACGQGCVGNADKMIAEDGGAFTAHTTNPVPLVLVDASGSDLALSGAEGCLADIAPTLLAMIGLPQPSEMTGESLLA